MWVGWKHVHWMYEIGFIECYAAATVKEAALLDGSGRIVRHPPQAADILHLIAPTRLALRTVLEMFALLHCGAFISRNAVRPGGQRVIVALLGGAIGVLFCASRTDAYVQRKGRAQSAPQRAVKPYQVWSIISPSGQARSYDRNATTKNKVAERPRCLVKLKTRTFLFAKIVAEHATVLGRH